MIDITNSVTIRSINGSATRGGWQCEFTAMQDTDLLDTHQQIAVTWRGGFGAPPGVERTAFIGYVIPSRFEFTRQASTADFVAQTSDGFLRKGWLQGIGFAEVAARANYHQFNTAGAASDNMNEWMTSGKLIKHILGYYDTGVDLGPNWVAHTNLVHHPTQNPHGWISLDHVELGNSMHTVEYKVRETDNVWERLREIANNEFYWLTFDKTDTLYYRPHPMYEVALPTPVMTFDRNFCVVPPIVEPRADDRVRQVVLHAVTDYGDNTADSEYPLSPTHVYGRVEEINYLRCNDPATLDLWAQRHYQWLNRDYTVRWRAPGLCGLLFEIMDRVQITYTGTSYNGVHINWNAKKFWIHEITVTPQGKSGVTEFVLEAENV